MPIPSPIHQWNFDEQSGTAAADAIGGQHATADRLALVAGKLKNALRFGGNDGARVVSIGAPDLPPPWTIAVWVRRDKDTSGGALLSSVQGAIKVEQWGTKSKLGITKFGVGDWSIDKALPLGEWTQLVVVGSAADTRFYLDGALAGSIPQSLNLPRAYLGSSTAWAEFLEAALDDLKIYNQALSPDQVTELYTAATLVEKPKNTWTRLGDSATFVTALTLPDGRFAVFAIATDGRIWTRRQTMRGGDFSVPTMLAEKGVLVAAGLNADGRVAVAYTNTDNIYFVRTEKTAGGDWGEPQRIAGNAAEPFITSHQDGRLVVLVRSISTAKVYASTQKTAGGVFEAEEDLGGSVHSRVIAAQSASGLIHVFMKWTDQSIWCKAQTKLNGPIDGPWTNLGGGCEGQPAVILAGSKCLQFFTRGQGAGNLWSRIQAAPSGAWGEWSNLEGTGLDPMPVLTAANYVHAYLRGGNNQLYVRTQSASGWSPWTSLGGDIRGRPAPVANSAGVAIFAISADSTLGMYW